MVQTDSSRVISLMIQNHGRSKINGVTQPHHILSHHGQDESTISELQRVKTSILCCFARMLSRLEEIGASGKPLLDSTSALFGSNLDNANSHDTKNLPILLAGGDYQHGGFVKFEETREAQLSDLFLTMLVSMGTESKSFGQSTGALSWHHDRRAAGEWDDEMDQVAGAATCHRTNCLVERHLRAPRREHASLRGKIFEDLRLVDAAHR
ncbi:MAG: DUF1552 domain-containing protein [Planctomycetota bacterium]|nr:DUF1552 domain-containing protein [Planctomycetota bacterium]